MASYGQVAAKVAKDKELHPEKFCPEDRCLWKTGDGSRCPRHGGTREIITKVDTGIRRRFRRNAQV